MTEDELEPLLRVAPDLLLVGGFSIILKEPLLSLPKVGCLNTHSSLLPKHRGPNPFAAVLLSGDTESGVTFHVIDEGIDTGDIVSQFPFPLEARDNGSQVHRRACQVAMDHVVEVIDRVEREGLRGTPQDHSAATYEKKVKPEDAFIDWHDGAEAIDRKVRALMPFVFARCRYRGKEVRLCRTEIHHTPTDAAPGTILRSRPHLKVATGDGALEIKMALRSKPFLWWWPSTIRPPKPGEKLD
jgi:methionyl-tRNA formyltransferase